ncbi:hypothetical protein A3A03_01510 [Candidatus Nomurabacteria bacterium RIFCSPLOWO2_01_FULL_40_18]|uniref:Uncharacterized protein n=1 Tax=Candidatus Nomurabacteria bacterium RIFCSPLOWO2_01_FULL_40_18 TaxID=1801773 RepID=A0A1F6XKU6_9BACT|nr:MAG: hypothetical protein A3A03_01510 [Candidatus Nomurabacteria bacterium RIFCSPLOWO2_01_FULL_40_18]
MKKTKTKKDEWEGFDDCAICQAMKNGKADNMEDLMKAFQEAEKSGIGKVGFGDIHNNDKSIPSPYSKK